MLSIFSRLAANRTKTVRHRKSNIHIQGPVSSNQKDQQKVRSPIMVFLYDYKELAVISFHVDRMNLQ